MLTAVEIFEEYAKCLDNPIYAIETYLQTFDKTQEGFVPFKLFVRQKEIVRAYEKHRFNLVTKPRQAGISTTTQGYCAIKIGFADPNNPETIIVIANKLTLAKKFLKGIKDYVNQLPRWVWGNEYYGDKDKEKKSIFVKDSQIEVELPNGSRIIAVATSEDALRGYTPTYLIFDEAAFIDRGADLYAAAVTSLGTGGRAILISTPNGYDPLYYKTYEQAKRGENTYNIIELKWYEDPRYNKDLSWTKNDETVKEYEFKLDSYAKRIKDGWKPASSWYINMCKNMNNDKKKIAQELDVSFLGSGGNVIDDEYIDFHEKNNVTEPKYVDKTYYDGNSGLVWIWSEPIEDHEYIMACLPPNEKVLTNNGLKNIEDVVLTDKLINEYGNYVDIINKQTHSVVDEDVFEVSIDNTFRTTKFTKEHPILISKPILKRNYIKNNEYLKFNQRYWDFNFNYTKAENIEVGDWIKVPNIYNKEIKNVLDDKWVIAQNFRFDFSIESPLKDKDFWWFIGMWLGDGWLSKLNDSYSITICFDSKDEYYLNKTNEIITRLFGRSASFIDKGQNTFALVFNSKFLYHFILENFGQYSYGKKINEWVKFIPKEFKIELIKGYLASDGCWLKHKKGDKINSKVSFVSINLELLESIQDIIFSLGVISSLNKLRVGGESYIRDKIINQKDTYQLSLCNNDSVELINLLNNDNLDPKLNKFILSEFNIINKRSISSCHFNDNKDFIYFRVKHIDKTKYSGNVYNFECDTHTFMCHHITTHNCDVARGDGADYSCFQIIDFTTMEQVVEFQGKIPPDSFAEMLNIYGLKYDAFLIVDNIGVGNTTTSKLVELKYPNLYYDEKTKDNKVAGFNINGCRLQLISNLEIAIRTNTIKINSIRLIHEMKTYIYKNGRPDHMEGYNDDCLMSLGMALWILESSFKSLKKAKAQTKAILAGWTVGGSDGSTSTITTIDPISNKKVTKINPNHSAYRNVQDPNGDYMWLFSGMR